MRHLAVAAEIRRALKSPFLPDTVELVASFCGD
jgi:hypothetical protein